MKKNLMLTVGNYNRDFGKTLNQIYFLVTLSVLLVITWKCFANNFSTFDLIRILVTKYLSSVAAGQLPINSNVTFVLIYIYVTTQLDDMLTR